MPDWARQLLQQRQRCVLVTLDRIVGSAPREAGARMVVTPDSAYGSIGGGNLEFQATEYARELLESGRSASQEHHPYSLGPALNQCCGGTVTLLYERFGAEKPLWLRALAGRSDERRPVLLASAIDRDEPFRVLLETDGDNCPSLPDEVLLRSRKLLAHARPGTIEALENGNETWWLEVIGSQRRPLYLFGAGHVGQAAARLLEEMPFDVCWVDGRPDIFPASIGSNITIAAAENAVAEVGKAPPGSIFVVMTHSHQLDEDICFGVLSRGDFAWLGLIGSVTKRRRFMQRLAQRGIGEQELARLVCPIGLPGIRGRQPATIALSLVAQLMHEAEPGNEVNDDA